MTERRWGDRNIVDEVLIEELAAMAGERDAEIGRLWDVLNRLLDASRLITVDVPPYPRDRVYYDQWVEARVAAEHALPGETDE